MTAYPVFYAHSYHAGEFWRLKPSTRKSSKSVHIHDFLFFMFLIILEHGLIDSCNLIGQLEVD